MFPTCLPAKHQLVSNAIGCMGLFSSSGDRGGSRKEKGATSNLLLGTIQQHKQHCLLLWLTPFGIRIPPHPHLRCGYKRKIGAVLKSSFEVSIASHSTALDSQCKLQSTTKRNRWHADQQSIEKKEN